VKRHGMIVNYEPVLPDFDELDATDIAFLTKAKQAHDPEPDPYRQVNASYHRLNFGDLG
jgi:hypothetical protein